MLMATFYPLIDGGIQQIIEVYRGLRQGVSIYGNKNGDSTPTSFITETTVNKVGVESETAPKLKE
jgi:hypothetical protein